MSTATQKLIVPKRLEILGGPGFNDLHGQLNDIARSISLEGRRFPFTFRVKPMEVPDEAEFTINVLLSGLASVHANGYPYFHPTRKERESLWNFCGVTKGGEGGRQAGLYVSLMFGGADPMVINYCRGQFNIHDRSGYIEPGTWSFE